MRICLHIVGASSTIHYLTLMPVERNEIESFPNNLISCLIYQNYNSVPSRIIKIYETFDASQNRPPRRLKNSFLRRNLTKMKSANSGPRMAIVTQQSVKLRALVRERGILENYGLSDARSPNSSPRTRKRPRQ